MTREGSDRELRDHGGDARAGKRVPSTVDRLPLADIVPDEAARSPWSPLRTLCAILGEAGADPGLLDDLGNVRSGVIDDAWSTRADAGP